VNASANSSKRARRRLWRQGRRSPLAFRWYDKDRSSWRRLEDHLRFAVCYWHSFCWPGGDPFGGETFLRPWHHGTDAMAHGARQGRHRLRAVPPARRALLHLPRRRCRAGRRPRSRSPSPTSTRFADLLRAEDGFRQGAAALGHGQPVHASPLHGWRRDQSGSGILHLCRRPGRPRSR
jgi:hypothetical protein